MMPSSFWMILGKVVLDVERDEWNHIVNDRHIDSSVEFVVQSRKLMENRSLAPFDVTTSVHIVWWMMANSLKIVVTERFEVELGDLHDNM